MFNFIIFGERNINEAHQCFQVGLLGCKSIQEQQEGVTGGIEAYSYIVSFNDGSSQEIKNTIYVSD